MANPIAADIIPIRTESHKPRIAGGIVEAPNKLAAEEAAARLGFSEPWAHPVRPEEVQRAEWLPKHKHSHRQEVTRKRSRGIHI